MSDTQVTVVPAVLVAMHAISAELAKTGIAKDSFNKEQRFSFRGIDAVMNKLAPLLVEHRLLIIPRFHDRVQTEKTTKAGNLMFNVTVRGEFHFVSVLDGTEVIAHTIGEGQDSADKATNKAMAIAYKYAVFQTFCIPLDASDDPDSKGHDDAVDPTKGKLDDLTAEFDLRSLEAGDLKELADMFAAAQAQMKAEAKARAVAKDVLVDALGQLGKAKDTAKDRIQKKAKPKNGPRGDEPGGPTDPTQEAAT